MEKWNGNEPLLQAVDYFKKPEFRRLFEGLRERYTALSHLGGSIHLKKLTKEEAEALEGFLQINIRENSAVTVSIRQIRKSLKNTRYGECGLEEIVPLVLQEVMVSKKEERNKEEWDRKAFFNKMSAQYDKTLAGSWFDKACAANHPISTVIARDYNSNREWLMENLPLILNAINQLPALSRQYRRLPVFAAAITGNPHYFDEGKRSLVYLLYAIHDLCAGSSPTESGLEARAELLYSGGILKDDLSNWVLCYGIRGFVSDKEPHKGMEEYCRRGEPQILTLQNLSLLQSVAITGREVYVVENPSVFSWLVGQNKEDCAFLCSGGQLRLSVLVMLDLLVKNDITVYYSGDYDPEGLSIAQKLISRYGSRLKLWCYNEEIYHKAISSEIISERRLKQLENLQDDALITLGKLLKEYRRSGYQENVMGFITKGVRTYH